MAFKLGVVGHRETLDLVASLVKEYFNEVEVLTEEFGNDENITEAVERIARLQLECDGILYSRKDPYLLISGRLNHTVPVRYVEVDKSHLLISLFRATIRYGFQPTNVSIDTFDCQATAEALLTVGIPRDRLMLRPVTVAAEGDTKGFVKATLAQHLANYEDGAQLCVTNVTDVYNSLLSHNVPAALINPTVESFVHEIRNLILRYRLKSQNASPLSVLYARLRYKEKFRSYGMMPIREIDELDKAAKLVLVFAEKLDGAMFALSRWEYLLLCSRVLLEETTDHFTEIALVEHIDRDTVFDVSLSIGCGGTVREAHSNAILASNSAFMKKTSNTVVALSREQIIGPITPKSEHFAQDSLTETRLQEIARTAGLSANTVNRLYQATRRRNSSLFTSAELAEILEVSIRTSNRIIQRLTEQRYARVAGKNLVKPRGRPQRVIRLLL